MNYFEFINSVKILSGENALNNIPYELDFFGANNPLIISDRGLEKVGSVKLLIDTLKNSKLNLGNLFLDIPTDSSFSTIKSIIDFYKQNNCDSLIALGGGSVIDTAKIARLALSQDKDNLEDIMGNEIIKKGKLIPFIVIPTTAGTGSECTSVAVIKNEKTMIKMEFISQEILPNVAVIDPILTKNLPLKLTASTCIDALSHAIEAFSGIQKNIISDGFAISAIKLISQSLPLVIKDSSSLELRNNLAVAATLAGISFSNSMVGVVHAIGHSIGAVCGIPHGNAMAILLPHCMKFNLDTCEKEYAELLLYLTNAETFASTPKEIRAKKAIEYVENLILMLNKTVGLPIKLSEYGVSEKKFDEIVNKALNDGAVIINKKNVTSVNIKKILSEAL